MKTIFLVAAAAAALVAAAGASAQVRSYLSTNEPVMKGDPNKIVCKAEESLGTRLGKRKVCLTVQQWNEKAREQREFAEDIQSGAWGRQSDPATETKMPGSPP